MNLFEYIGAAHKSMIIHAQSIAKQIKDQLLRHLQEKILYFSVLQCSKRIKKTNPSFEINANLAHCQLFYFINVFDRAEE